MVEARVLATGLTLLISACQPSRYCQVWAARVPARLYWQSGASASIFRFCGPLFSFRTCVDATHLHQRLSFRAQRAGARLAGSNPRSIHWCFFSGLAPPLAPHVPALIGNYKISPMARWEPSSLLMLWLYASGLTILVLWRSELRDQKAAAQAGALKAADPRSSRKMNVGE